MKIDSPTTETQQWLLLLHQLPPKPAYFRVRIWRRLQDLGAVAIKNSVYALPAGDETREDFEWLLREIVDGGGEACICEARMVDGLSDQDIRAQFDEARDADYREIADEARALAETSRNGDAGPEEARTEIPAKMKRLRKRLAAGRGHRFLRRQRPPDRRGAGGGNRGASAPGSRRRNHGDAKERPR